MQAQNGWGFASVVVESLAAIAWPVALFCIAWILREDLRRLLPSLFFRHGETEIGFKRLSELVDQVQEHTLQQAQPAVARSTSVTATSNLSGLSDDALRQEVEDCALQMREMERRFRAERNAERFDDRTRDWAFHTHQLLSRSDRQRAEWQTTLLPRAVALRDELLTRLNRQHEDDKFDHGFVFQGALAGPDPLNQGALHLEQLARELTGPGGRPTIVPTT